MGRTAVIGISVALCSTHAFAQQAPSTAKPAAPSTVKPATTPAPKPTAAPAAKPAAATGANFSATSANVSEPGSPVTIKILRWSTDEERAPLVTALTPPPPPPPAAAAPADAGANPAAAAGERGAGAAAGRAARGGAAAGGRGGRGRGGAAAPLTPTQALTAAIGRAPTIGYIWTNDVTGYAIKYAWRTPLPNGGERIILASDRRLGADNPAWKPAAATPPTDYEFTLIEIRTDAKGTGEAKASLTANVVVDSEAKTIALDNYAAAPAILQNVRR